MAAVSLSSVGCYKAQYHDELEANRRLRVENRALSQQVGDSSKEVELLSRELEETEGKVTSLMGQVEASQLKASQLEAEAGSLMLSVREYQSVIEDLRSGQKISEARVQELRANNDRIVARLREIEERWERRKAAEDKLRELNRIEGITVEEGDTGFKVTVTARILFDVGAWELSASGEGTLGRIAEGVKRVREVDASVVLLVIGHSDKQRISGALRGFGGRAIRSNLDLSDERARSVARRLSKLGVKSHPMGRGDLEPLCTHPTPDAECHERNRRVEFRIFLSRRPLGELGGD